MNTDLFRLGANRFIYWSADVEKVNMNRWKGVKLFTHCRISYVGGLGTSPCIMGLTTQDSHIQKEHTELYKILKFRVNWANIEQGTGIQKLQNLQIPDKCPAIHTFVTKFSSF